MASRNVYTCDICKKEKEKDELSRIDVSANGIRIRGLYRYNDTLHIDICRKCLVDKGFIVEYKREEYNDVAGKNRATLEEKLMDILMDLGVSFEE